MADTVEFQESNSICFEWTLKGLKNLFESSKGEAKSKVTKSVKFGGGRWQVLFYANSGTGSGSGTDNSGYISLFLSCEPTLDEKEKALNSRWVRDGLFRFTFELHNLAKKDIFGVKEAHNHSFSYKTANWGWAQFARRDAVYYSRNIVKAQDAFVIICNISSSPLPPQSPPEIPRMSVPKDLLDSVGMLLDDPLYSDVEFVLPSRGAGRRTARSIFGAKRLLSRADYFDSMFNSGFAEASDDKFTIAVGAEALSEISDGASESTALGLRLEDSDEEDEEECEDIVGGDPPNFDFEREGPSVGESAPAPPPASPSKDVSEPVMAALETSEQSEPMEMDDEERASAERNVRPKLTHPSSPRSAEPPHRHGLHGRDEIPGPSKQRVVVKDVAYATYRAVLYYLYTDAIWFAPLSSSFLSTPAATASTVVQTPNDSQANLGATMRTVQTQGESYAAVAASSRREWIQDWARNNSGRPVPCSAKAVYRLADKLDLVELKERAFQHITKSLTVENVPYEVFSTFSATFEVVRKVEVKFFLDHWADIRGSDAMRNVWHQIRLGRHPGFEEVWPVIATNLEFKPQRESTTGSDKEEVIKAVV